MTYYWITDDDLGSLSTEDALFDPGPGWHTVTEAEYDTFVGGLPNAVHDDVHAFLDGAGIVDSDARAAFHRLMGVGH